MCTSRRVPWKYVHTGYKSFFDSMSTHDKSFFKSYHLWWPRWHNG
jgi:hypothetical protein